MVKQSLAPGMERFLVKDAGGRPRIDLHIICSKLLRAAHDGECFDVQRARQLVSLTPAKIDFKRMQARFGDLAQPGEDGVLACLRVILSQLTLRGFLHCVEDRWEAGPELAVDTVLTIVTLDERSRLEVRLEDAQAPPREADRLVAQRRMDIHAGAARLEPAAEGLRPVDPDNVQTIVDSVQEYGLWKDVQFQVLRDQYGRILSGRHRLAAAQQLGIVWPERVIKVENDEHALALALVANMGRSWTTEDLRKLRGLTKTVSGTGKRELAKVAIQENPGLSPQQIAERAGVDRKTVVAAQRELETDLGVPRSVSKPGPPKQQDKEARVRAAWLARPDATSREIGNEVGCSHVYAGDVRTAMVAAGDIAPSVRMRSAPRAGPTKREVVLDALPADTALTAKQIGEQYGLDVGTVGAELKHLEREGRVEKTGEMHAGSVLWRRVVVPQGASPARPVQDGRRKQTGPAAPPEPLRADEGPNVGYAGELRADEPDVPAWWGALETGRPDHVICGRGVMDGARTLSEAADFLERYAAYLRQKEREGWQLVQTVMDDSGPARRGG